ncbi:MAG: C13 family peptidase [Methanospirillum sp.]
MRGPLLIILVVLLIGSLALGAISHRDAASLKIGVLLPLTGPDAVDSEAVLNWARDEINRAGGIDRRPIELVYKDTNGRDPLELAREFIDDRSIRIVIGPGSSSGVYEIAPLFVKNKKILISPFASAGDILRAFGRKEYFWRTCQSDVAQVRLILDRLSGRGTKKIALVYEDSVYGKTFFEWTGFFATEQGIELLNVVPYERGHADFSQIVDQALEGDPEYVICAAFPEDAMRIKGEMDRTGSSARLFFTDAAESGYLVDSLGKGAEGLEGISPSADPASGFEEVYRDRFGHDPSNFAAGTYDALFLAACTLARQEYAGGGLLWFAGEGIDQSFRKVVAGQETGTNGSSPEIGSEISAILQGREPIVRGASGSLKFDEELGVDPVDTCYSFWRIENGNFTTVATVHSGSSSGNGTMTNGVTAYRARAGSDHEGLQETGEVLFTPGEREDTWAVIIATSGNWTNYRHQADALAMYDLLKQNGIKDDKIILFLVDDIADNEDNPLKGDVHHSIGGKNFRKDAVIDYAGANVTQDTFVTVLLGDRSAANGSVLETTRKSNLFVYIVDHGINGSILFHDGGELTAERLAETLDRMYAKGQFRQMFIAVEACCGESMALGIDTPGVVLLTSAARNESSRGYEYDSEIGAWLSDDFSAHLLSVVSADPSLSIEDVYTTVYGKVTGSHVRLANYDRFGNISTTLIGEFLFP